MTLAAEILLVDDTPENLRVLASILRAEGCQVRLATSGVQALRSVATRPPDLVLLDVHMPEMDGIATCQRLRQDPSLCDMPILFLSASDAVDDRLAAFAAGGQDFISKPFQAPEVIARVTTHLHLAQARIELARFNARLADQVVVETRLRADAEDDAADRQARLDLTLDAAELGTWDIDPADGQVRFDARACRMLGLPPSGRCPWRTLLAGMPDPDRAQPTDRFETEGWWPAAGPTRIRIRLRGRRLLADAEGGPDRLVGLVWDVSEDYRLREQLNQRDRLESVGLLAGGVAHDFNNQLAVIVAELDILEMMLEPGDAHAHLGLIAQAASASSVLVRDLLSFARQREIIRAPIDICEVVGRAARLAGRTLGPGIQVAVTLPAGPHWVHAEAAQLENAILNLCINARDAMPAGGRLEIGLSGQEPAGQHRCDICHEPVAGRWTAIRVADTGTGMPEDVRTRIFEPFFSTKGERRGHGLGLASVAGCVAMHGGHMTVESTVGQGTVMTLFLAPVSPPAAPAPVSMAGAARSGRLLLLDDQASVREAIADGLKRLAWSVDAFDDPAAAIAAWSDRQHGYDLALVDMSMPGMSGAAVFRALRKAKPTACVVLMSGHAGGDSMEALIAEGLAGFVEKPVKLRELANVLGSILATKASS